MGWLDWINDFWNELCNFFSNIFDAISQFFSDFWRELCRVFTNIWEAIEDYWVIIVVVIIIVCVWYFAPALMGYATVLEGSGSIGSWIAIHNTCFVAAITAFTQAIHLSALLTISSVLETIWPQYRQMIGKVYQAVGNYSQAIGQGDWVPILLMNARVLVMDASTSMGKPYNLAELTWFANLEKWTKVLVEKAAYYQEHPETIMMDIEDILVKEAQDGKAGVMRFVFSFMDATSAFTKKTLDTFVKIEADVNKLIKDLPDFIVGEYRPMVSALHKEFRDFVDKNFTPAYNAIRESLGILYDYHYQTRELLVNTERRINKPGSLFDAWHTMTAEARDDDERAFLAATQEKLRVAIEDTSRLVAVYQDEALEAILGLAKREDRPPPSEIGEFMPKSYEGLPESVIKDWEIEEYEWPKK